MPSTSRQAKLFSPFVLAVLLFAAVNFSMGKLSSISAPKLSQENFQDLADASQSGRPCSWWLSRAYLDEKNSPDVVLFGSSQLGCLAGADARFQNRKLDFVTDKRCKIFESKLKEQTRYDASVFSCGSPGQMISDHYLIAKSFFPLRKPRLIVLTLAPRDFIDNFLADVTATESYRFFAKYLSDDAASRKLLLASWPEQVKDSIEHLFPMKGVSQLIPWNSLIGRLPLPSPAQKQEEKELGWLFSVNPDSDLMHPLMCMTLPEMPRDFKDNTLEYSKRYHNCNPPIYLKEVAFLNQLLQYAQEEKIKVLVVGMPLTAANRALLPEVFWSNYKMAVKTACAQNQAALLDLSDAQSQGFVTSDFIDTVHLSQDGGEKLIGKITTAIAQDRSMRMALSLHSSQIASN